MSTIYKFRARGKTPDGNKFKAEGDIVGPDMDGVFPPHEIAERARALVEETFVGCTFDDDRVVHGIYVKSYPVVWPTKKKPSSKKS